MATENRYYGLELVLSGGNENTFPALSIGGLPSLEDAGVISGQSFVMSPSMNGVFFRSSRGCATGLGSLNYNPSTGTLTLTASDLSVYDTLVGGDGLYRLGPVILRLVTGQLPISNTTVDVTISDKSGQGIDNVEYDERLTGVVDYRCFYVANRGLSSYDVIVSIEIDPDYSDLLLGTEFGISIGFSPALAEEAGYWWPYGVQLSGTGTLPHEVIRHTGLGFFIPISGVSTASQACFGTQDGAVLLSNDITPNPIFGYIPWSTSLSFPGLQVGEYRSFWVKREVPNNTGTLLLSDAGLLKLQYGD